ncbi:DUF3291 domain-containing protein [Maribacter luteus]|uniref:DUF3291 domain-containing protein n=1 Tax=Maribacter luteus TaxID=2594478 RepID=A0A6I2MKW0_9FLAO|nr:DUF3291 domain-containing protein [Maribacter luteus]MRX63407.1 DUF3291 domain-containing protein [Maribacter luteus]
MHLAQVNIAKMKPPIDSPIMADFVNNLDSINAIADKSKGFVWRLKDEEDNATAIKIFDNDYLIINMSVWENATSLKEYVYNSMHVEVLKRKKEWFDKMEDMHMALWYVKEGIFPTPSEAKERLEYLQTNGETPYAFSFKSKFKPEDL